MKEQKINKGEDTEQNAASVVNADIQKAPGDAVELDKANE